MTIRPKLDRRVLTSVVKDCRERVRPLEDQLFSERERERTRTAVKDERQSALTDKYRMTD